MALFIHLAAWRGVRLTHDAFLTDSLIPLNLLMHVSAWTLTLLHLLDHGAILLAQVNSKKKKKEGS